MKSDLRALAITLALLPSAGAWAGDGLFGTKTSPVPAATGDSTVSAFPIIQMLLALAIVLALIKWAMPAAIKKFGHKLPGARTGDIKIEDSASLGSGNLFVVNVRGKTLLLGSTAENIACIADLTAVPKTEPVPTFREILDSQANAPATPADAAGNGRDLGDLAQQLERLRQLGL